jgi:hypothetical protein
MAKPERTPFDETEIPASLAERAMMMHNLMVAHATGLHADSAIYEALRREFMASEMLKPVLPDFVRTCRTLDVFWPYIKGQTGTYAERRHIIGTAFVPLLDYLENRHRAPVDDAASETLQTFDSEGVHAVWQKAFQRRHTDAEGAITIARTLLETVCKRILDELQIEYTDKEDLPKLYSMTASASNLAPNQHSEDAIKSIFGGAIAVVNGIGTLRNKLSDSHGRGGRPVKPAARHANLAVNMAGTLATFLVETHTEKKQ